MSLRSEDIARALALVGPALPQIAARIDGKLIPRLGQPYLERRYLTHRTADDGPLPGMILHKFVSSDSPTELHNHPWEWAVSIILSGRYYERRAGAAKLLVPSGEEKVYRMGELVDHVFEPFEVNIIMANDFHRVELIGGGPVWTLFIHGPRVQDWGFVDEGYDCWKVFRPEKLRTFTDRPSLDKETP